MTDTERLDKLETLVWSSKIGNGLVIFPSITAKTGVKNIVLHDLGDEDGSNIGDELSSLKPSLREAIDAV